MIDVQTAILSPLLFLFLSFLPLNGSYISSQTTHSEKEKTAVSSSYEYQNDFPNDWAAHYLSKMSIDEKIGQLFMAPLLPNLEEPQKTRNAQLIREYHLGGVILMQGTLNEQIQLINAIQKHQEIPLLVAQDAEWGLNMRISDAIRYPKNMTLGAIQDDLLLMEFGREAGRQCKAAGVHINFAPVVDVNNNPENPVINDRSFGEDPQEVARRGVLVMQGMQESGIIACAKHFPGHGDTTVDSHLALPAILHSSEHLANIELYPFQKLIEAGIKSVMIGHLHVPALDPLPGSISSLSYPIVTTLLKQKMNFNGLVITDSLNMKGVCDQIPASNLPYLALKAGNDILLYAASIPEMINKIYTEYIPEGIAGIKQAFNDGLFLEKELDQQVLKILTAKQSLGLHQDSQIPSSSILPTFHPAETKKLKRKLYEAAITVVNDQQAIIPLNTGKPIALITIGGGLESPFYQTLRKHIHVNHYPIALAASFEEQQKQLEDIHPESQCIIALLNMNRNPKTNFGLTMDQLTLIQAVNKQRPTLLAVFGNPYSLSLFDSSIPAIVAYENDIDAQKAAAEVILGITSARGKLPVKSPFLRK